MTREEKLEALCRVAKLLADRAAAPVAQEQAKVMDAQGRVEQLASHRQQLAAPPGDVVLAALSLQQDGRLRQAHAAALRHLAERTAGLEIAKGNARPAVGRYHALDALLAQERARNKGRGTR